MNKLLFIITIVTTSLMSCSPVVTPLTGSYMEKPYEIKVDKDFEQVWSNVIDLFARKGLSIQVIDKASGLIVSEQTSLLQSYTFEDSNGKLIDNNAWIIVQKITLSRQVLLPIRFLGSWNIRLKKIDDNKTIINVNLNINSAQGQWYNTMTGKPSGIFYTMSAKSTGNFEKMISNMIQ